jgi:hypothetical protein
MISTIPYDVYSARESLILSDLAVVESLLFDDSAQYTYAENATARAIVVQSVFPADRIPCDDGKENIGEREREKNERLR